jgi:hypothetical protein
MLECRLQQWFAYPCGYAADRLWVRENNIGDGGKHPIKKTEITAVGIRHADHVGPSIRRKLSLTLPTSGGHSVGIVRSRTQATEFVLFVMAENTKKRG